jgi:hypothetical protein
MSVMHRCASIRRSAHAVLGAAVVTLLVSGCQLLGAVDSPAGSGAASSPAAAAPAATPTPRQTVSLPEATPLPPFTLYTVRSGDTLLSIAMRFRTSSLSVSYWNRDRYPSLDPDTTTYAPNRIEAGWSLRLIPGIEADPEDFLPPGESSGDQPSGSPTAVPTPPPSPATSPTATPASSSAATGLADHGLNPVRLSDWYH